VRVGCAAARRGVQGGLTGTGNEVVEGNGDVG
jgi:hypothetical protein